MTSYNKNDPKYGSNLLDNVTFSIDIDNLSVTGTDNIPSPNSDIQHTKTVKIIHCGDGIVEECEEDELEKEKIEKEKREQELELQRKMEIEAKKLSWLPWSFYMAKRTAFKTYEACDYAGEKLAWWLGITKPKFLYEIEEALRIQKEEEERAKQDMAEELVIDNDGQIKVIGTTANPCLNSQFVNDENETINSYLFNKNPNYDESIELKNNQKSNNLV